MFFILILPFRRYPYLDDLFGQVTFPKVVGGACLLYALAYMAITMRVPPFFRTVQAWLFYLFCGVILLSYLTCDSLAATSALQAYMAIAMLFVAVMILMNSVRRVRYVLWSEVLAVSLASLVQMREWQINGFSGRAYGWVVGDANYFSVPLLIGIPLAITLFLDSRSAWAKTGGVFCVGLMGLALVAGGSREALVGLLAAAFVLIVYSKRRLPLIIAGLGMLVLLSFSHSSPLTRILNASHSDNEAVQARLSHWAGALKMVQAHPMTGVGVGTFKEQIGSYVDLSSRAFIAHNAYLEIAAEMGLPAILLFLGILAYGYRDLSKVRCQARLNGQQFLYRAAIGLQAGFAGSAVAIGFHSGEYQKMLWLTLFLSMRLPSLLRCRAAKADRPEETAGDEAASEKEPAYGRG